MNEFDDRELRDALRRRAGAATDGFGLEAARSAVVARSARARRRRAAVAGGAAMAGLIAAAVFVVGPGTDSVVTTPSDTDERSTPTQVDTSVDSTAAVPTDPDRSAPDTSPPSATSPDPASTLPGALPPTVPPTVTTLSTTSPTAPGTTAGPPPPSSEPTQPTPPTSGTAPSSTAPTGPAPFTETYTSDGGSITVRWDGAALLLQSVSPAIGFEAEVEDNRADRIRVRFRGDSGDSRIELRFQDGQVIRVE